MGKLLRSVAVITCLLISHVTLAQDSENPYEMVKEAGTRTFDRIKAEREQIKKNPDILRTIMIEELLPHVDYKFSALKVLGKQFKNVPQDKIPEFIQVFRDYLVTTYAIAMAQYDNQTVVFEPAQPIDDDRMVTVRALVKEPGRPDIKIAFKVRKNSRTDEWKAFDMVAEGISLLSSKQSELEGIIRQEGIDAVIKLLKEKNAQSIVLDDKTEAKS
ncbi:MlaC/ttg2D family ABC transporter substrate-binding protein [Neptunicella marina]|uniref:ABC transporter substrate-binding protein n=1 Tax=Neptunicella marina TaxID=2125989 RepID=A0A8J6ITR3_9ALTE|nr:ABC transporter substrate-binding protein [Neptunicella marina]MBC3765253.1 ABC transporter substrate-binding protein [Neptunicella marina]